MVVEPMVTLTNSCKLKGKLQKESVNVSNCTTKRTDFKSAKNSEKKNGERKRNRSI